MKYSLYVWVLVFVIVVNITSSGAIRVTRFNDGDIYELQPGKKCTNTDAVPFVPPNERNPPKELCKCTDLYSTVIFDYESNEICYNMTEIGKTLLYVEGANNQIPLVRWINGTWQFVSRPLLHEDGTKFNPNSCSVRDLVFREFTDYDPALVEYNLQLVYLTQPANTEMEMIFQINSTIAKQKELLQGRLFEIQINCDVDKSVYFGMIKFAGTRTYTLTKPTSQTTNGTQPSETTEEDTSTTTETQPSETTEEDTSTTTGTQTSETTEEDTSTTTGTQPSETTEEDTSTTTGTQPSETTEENTPYTVQSVRGLNRDTFDDEECDVDKTLAYNMSSRTYGCIGLESFEVQYKNTGEDKDEMLVYRQNNIDTTDYPIYTIWYENLKWKQYDPQISRLNFAGVYSKLTSVEADCTSGNVSITSIYIFTLDGWALWTGSYQNIFTLDMHVGSGSFTYSIKFNYVAKEYYDAFVGHLLDIRMECANSPIYHLFVKFQGQRTYQSEDVFPLPVLMTTPKPTQPSTTVTTTAPSSSKDTGNGDTYIIVGVVVGGIVFIVLMVLLYCFCKARMSRRRRRKFSSQNEMTASNPWSKSAQTTLNIPEDPKQKEAKEIIELAKEIINERKSVKDRPDVIPKYIQNRPAPRYEDPRPKIGPLAATRPMHDGYEALKFGGDNEGFSSEDTYLDLEKAQEDFFKEQANTTEGGEYQEMKPDPTV